MSLFSLVRRHRSSNVKNQNPSSNGKPKFASFGYFVAASVVTLGLATSAQAQTACTGGATLKGTYAIFVNGNTANSALKGITGNVTFNGACGLTVSGLVTNENGAVPMAFTTATGSYNTNADGTITINMVNPAAGNTDTYVVNYLPLFNEAIGNETDSSASASVDLKAVGSVATMSSLKGTFAASGLIHDQLTMTFDGAGNLTLTDRSPSVPQGVSVTGTYFVYNDGSIGGYLTLGSTTYAYGGVVANSSNEFQFVLNSGPAAGYVPVEAFVAKRVK